MTGPSGDTSVSQGKCRYMTGPSGARRFGITGKVSLHDRAFRRRFGITGKSRYMTGPSGDASVSPGKVSLHDRAFRRHFGITGKVSLHDRAFRS